MSAKEGQHTGKAKVEITCIRKDGSPFPCELSSSVYKNAIGDDKTSMILRDITDRKKAEAAIIESETFNRGVINSLSSHIAVINKDGVIVKVNKSWRDFAISNGGANNNLFCEGANYFEVVNGQSTSSNSLAKQEIDGIKKVLTGELSEFYLEYPCHSPTEERWFYMRVLKFESTEIMALIEHHNITEIKKAEEQILSTSTELKRALTDVEKIMDSSLDIICSIDEAGKFVSVSSAAKIIWGYDPYELKGNSVYGFCLSC